MAENEPIKEGQRNILMAQTQYLQHCMTEEEFLKVIDIYTEITERLIIEKGYARK